MTTDKEVSKKMSESDNRVAQWDDEERYWRESFRSRPYVTADRGFDYYAPAYRYGFESAGRYGGRAWSDVEPELERGWTEYRRESKSTWQDIKDAVRDAWDRVTGASERAAKREMAEHMNPDVNVDRETR